MSTNPTSSPRENRRNTLLLATLGAAVGTALMAGLLISIYEHKQEAKSEYLRFVDVKQGTTAPEPWGVNWPYQYDQYKKTVDVSKTNFGGGDAIPAQKAEVLPFLSRMFAGYAFALDYHDRRGHAYMLMDQETTKRVTQKPQTGACLHCHASVIPTYVRLGGGDPHGDAFKEAEIRTGFEALTKMPYWDAHKEVEKTGSWDPTKESPDHFTMNAGVHPVSCTDCHNAQTMRLQVNRPGFVAGIRALKASQGVKDFDVNRDASRGEMRTFVCAQCHVEYYCGPKVPLFFPWNNGLKVEQIESYFNDYKFPDGHRFFDWQHAETGAEVLKAQHPEFEMWSQGVHAKSGVSCVDCHMPYRRQGALKVTDHHVRSPLLMVNQSCQQCHSWSEEELKGRVAEIQGRTFTAMQRAGQALTDFLDTYKLIREPFNIQHKAEAEKGAAEKMQQDPAFAPLSAGEKEQKLKEQIKASLLTLWIKNVDSATELKEIAELHRKGQWRLDFVAAENSMGFHAPQEATRILGEATDFLRQAQVKAARLAPASVKVPVTSEPAIKK